MADDTPEDAGLAADSGRTRRPPPTIDLEATDVTPEPAPDTAETRAEPQAEPEQGHVESEFKPEIERAEAEISDTPRPISPWIIAPFSGAVAAALVIAVGWMLGWPAVQAPPATPQVSAATVDALNGRIAGLEAKVNKPAAQAADPAVTARIESLEKSATALRNDVTALRTQSEKLAGAVDELKSAPKDAAAAPDLSAVNDRLVQLERTTQAQRAELAQQGETIAAAKAAQATIADKTAEAVAADDKPLRRAMTASLLDVAVHHGDPYAAQLAAAKSMANDPDALKPLEAFASSGIPSPTALSRELLDIVPKLSPRPQPEPAGTGIVGRLQASAAKLVRIERTDATSHDRGSLTARVTAAALRNDIAAARRDLMTLPDAERAPAKAWLDKVETRQAALAASRKFADAAMANLAIPSNDRPSSGKTGNDKPAQEKPAE